jgi:alkylated DNA repair dioxygenase AlkB
MPLFNCSPDLPNCFNYYANCFSEDKANALFDYLINEMSWQQPKINMFGKKILIPRKQVYMADEDNLYAYSGAVLKIEPWDPILKKISDRLSKQFSIPFNSVLINWYRDGNDSIAWHADDEYELGINPVIASISLGDARKIKVRDNKTKQVFEHLLQNGSCLLMQEESQKKYQHCIPKIAPTKQTDILRGRINLTFRYIHQGF